MKINRSFIVFLFLFLFSATLFGQQQKPAVVLPAYSYKPDKAYFKSYWTAIKKTATGPAHWNKNEWITFGGIAAGGTILYIYDDQIRDFFQSNRTHTTDQISKYGFEPWGSGLYTLPLLGGFYLYGLTAKNLKTRQVALGGTEAFVMSALSVTILKIIFGRHRPYQDDPPNPRIWTGPFGPPEYSSMPSGHATVAFSVATVFASVYKDKPWVGVISYGIATGVALSRLNDDKHWASDVFIGAALGFAVGKTVYHIMQDGSKLTVGVSETGGIGLVYHL
jgi:membrane-associated phospholipid phosphatase